MNVFILCTGRCGSVTFIEACKHITNYTSAHESRADRLGPERVDYPENHIEADNRLTWFLGRLDQAYGDDAIYVHLHRNKGATARSFSRRINSGGIITAYSKSMLISAEFQHTPEAISTDYCSTVEENIRLFLKDKSRTMDFELENAKACFERFWELIGAEGDLERARTEWDQHYNASKNKRGDSHGIAGSLLNLSKLFKKAGRIVKNIPRLIRYS